MAPSLSRAPDRSKDGEEILLSNFSHVALQVDAQRRLLRAERGRSKRGKKGQKKQPQRGLGVAQLEKIRLEEQRRAAQEAQFVALHVHGHTAYQHHAVAPFDRGAGAFLPQPQQSGPSFICVSAGTPSADGIGAFGNAVRTNGLRSCPPFSGTEFATSRKGQSLNNENLVLSGLNPLEMNSGRNLWTSGNSVGKSLLSHRMQNVDDPGQTLSCANETELSRSSSCFPGIQLRQTCSGLLQRQNSSNQTPTARLSQASTEGVTELSSFQSMRREQAANPGEMVGMRRRACSIVSRSSSCGGIIQPSGPGCGRTAERTEGDDANENEECRTDFALPDCVLSLRPPGEASVLCIELHKKRGWQEPNRCRDANSPRHRHRQFLSLGIPGISSEASVAGPPLAMPLSSSSATSCINLGNADSSTADLVTDDHVKPTTNFLDANKQSAGLRSDPFGRATRFLYDQCQCGCVLETERESVDLTLRL